MLAIKPSLPERKNWPVLIRLGAINIALFFSLLFVMAQTLPSAISGVGMISVPVFAMFFYTIEHKDTLKLNSGVEVEIMQDIGSSNYFFVQRNHFLFLTKENCLYYGQSVKEGIEWKLQEKFLFVNENMIALENLKIFSNRYTCSNFNNKYHFDPYGRVEFAPFFPIFILVALLSNN